MVPTSKLIIIPGDVSIDILDAVQKALVKLQRIRRPPEINWPSLNKVKSGVIEAIPVLTRRPPNEQIYSTKPKVVYRKSTLYEQPRDKAKRVKRELIDAGVSLYGLMKSESRYLHKILHDNETIEAVVYGQHHSNSAMLVATDERIIYLDRKPMATLFDEVSYEVVSGIEFDIHTLFATVVLHTPVKNYDIRFANLHCAEKFARHIETQRLEREQDDKEKEVVSEPPVIFPYPRRLTQDYPSELKEDMAGYYWLPTEEEERRKVQEGIE